MCGITGLLRCESGQSQSALQATVQSMADRIQHRGPDAGGTWANQAAGVALGHRRLAIVDLSAAGHQPMHSVSGRWVMVFNGEIYNHLALRAALQAAGAAPPWRGHSDTETLLAAFEHWGVEATLQRCVGMFAIALWNTQSSTLTLARDRFGEKPLYYGWVGSGAGCALVFGSELKALKAYAGFDAPVCRQALAQYLRFLYVPAPRSIYKGIFKLEPGCLLTVQGKAPACAPAQPLRPGQVHEGVSVLRWWSLSTVVEREARNPVTDDGEALRLLDAGLTEAVNLQCVADVPLGAFLSGGVDSSAIVALMQRQSSRPVKTFTIGFEEQGYNEAPHALAVARHLGTDHHEMRVTAQMAQDVVPLLPKIYCEPFADSSQIPTHLVCQAARQHVTVALSGDAGDELFAGYNRYFWGPRIWRRVAWMPPSARHLLGSSIAAVPMHVWDTMGKALGAGKGAGGVARVGEKLHKLAGRLQSVSDIDGLYLSLVSEWEDPGSILQDDEGQLVQEPGSLLQDTFPPASARADQLRMMYRDTLTYLPDDILCKVDRAAMATGLETRVPFLDHRVVELAWQLPAGMKIRNNTGKWILRELLYKHVPKNLIERPKAGFAIPIGKWLCGPLREWAENLLASERLTAEGFFRPEPVRSCWRQHLNGTRDHTASLWAVLMFQAWLEYEKSPYALQSGQAVSKALEH